MIISRPQSMAFTPQQHGTPSHGAGDWYYAKGHCLASTPIATDAILQEKLQDAAMNSDTSVVRLYAVVTPCQGAHLTR